MSFANRMIIFIVSLAMFMEALDTTIINTAIPVMSQSLQVNPIDLKIALISYLLSLAIFIPVSGWVADKYGAKRVFIVAAVIFTASSLWCGFVHHLLNLVLARIVQGLGGSLTLPVGRLILQRTFERKSMLSIMNRVVMIGALGMMVGPVVGGIIAYHFSWRWIFWVNVPFGILTIFVAQVYLKEMPAQLVPALDKLGFVLFGSGLAGFTFSLSAFSENAIPAWFALAIMLVSALLLVSYVFHSKHKQHPIIKTELFHLRTFQIATLGSLITRLGFGGLPFLLPILLQVSLGYSSQQAGVLVAPLALGMVMAKTATTALLRLLGYKKFLIINTLLVAVSLLAFLQINHHTASYIIGLLSFIFGLLISLQFSAMNSLAYAEISNVHVSAATSIMATLQQLAPSLGVAVAALLVHAFSEANTASFILTPAVFQHTFLVMGIVTALSTFVFARLHVGDGSQMIAGKM